MRTDYNQPRKLAEGKSALAGDACEQVNPDRVWNSVRVHDSGQPTAERGSFIAFLQPRLNMKNKELRHSPKEKLDAGTLR